MRLIPTGLGRLWTSPEFDLAGSVVSAGPDVPAELRTPGTKVWGMKGMPSVLFGDHSGTLAEYVLLDSSLLARLPRGMSTLEASGLGVVGCTAQQMLDNANVKQGDRILINGASGGVGSMAVQIAKATGLHVTATCSGANVAFVKGLGAEQIIDYRTAEPSLIGYLKDTCTGQNNFDAILDCVGDQPLYEACPTFLKPSGKVVRVGSMAGVVEQITNNLKNNLLPVFLGGTPRKWMFMNLSPDEKMVQQLLQYADAGKLKVTVDSEFEMDKALEAYDRLLSQRAKGKVAVKVS